MRSLTGRSVAGVFVEPCRYVATSMPNLTVVRVDAGHSPNAEVPDTFNAAVVSFLSGR